MAIFTKSTFGLLAMAALASAECYTFRARKAPNDMKGAEHQFTGSLWLGEGGGERLCLWEVGWDDNSPYYPGGCEGIYAALVTSDFNSMTVTPEGKDAVTFEYADEYEATGIFPPVFYYDAEVTNC